MPRLALTPEQQEALRALDWLSSSGQDDRRSGRTTVLALSYLRRLFLTRPLGMDREGWLEVEDHVPGNRHADQHLVVAIIELAQQLGYDGVERHPRRTCVRAMREGRAPRDFMRALQEFDEGPPEMERVSFEGVTTFKPKVGQPLRTPKEPKPQVPPRSLWDHLTED